MAMESGEQNKYVAQLKKQLRNEQDDRQKLFE